MNEETPTDVLEEDTTAAPAEDAGDEGDNDGGDVSADRVSDVGARFVLRLPIVPAVPSGAPEAVADPR